MKKLCSPSVCLLAAETQGKPYGYCFERMGRGPGDLFHKCLALLKVLQGGDKKTASHLPSATSVKNCCQSPSPYRSSSLLRAMSTSRTCTVNLNPGAKRVNQALKSDLRGFPKKRYKTRKTVSLCPVLLSSTCSHSCGEAAGLVGDLPRSFLFK